MREHGTIKLDEDDAYHFLMFTTRYVLGRKVHFVDWARRSLHALGPKLTPAHRQALATDIRRFKDFVNPEDKRQWYKLADFLERGHL